MQITVCARTIINQNILNRRREHEYEKKTHGLNLNNRDVSSSAVFRSNQLSVLPREICLLPLQVLLISNNRLVQLPDELGRMDRLTELDAACNQVTHLPPRMSDLRSLRSLSLRNNQLVYLPKGLCVLNYLNCLIGTEKWNILSNRHFK